MDMSYVCGQSHNKIVHTVNCRYMKMIPKENRRFFNTIKEASEAGYVRCKYCSKILRYLGKEKKQLEEFSKRNGLFFFYNNTDDSLEVISKTGKWKMVERGKKNTICLYHKNNNGKHPKDEVPGYHGQNTNSKTLMGYMNYILEHDKYRQENPLYNCQKRATTKGSKRWKKEKRLAEKIRRAQSIQYVDELIDNMSRGNIAY